MSRPPEHYDSSRKKCTQKKKRKKRFERPRYRLPFFDGIGPHHLNQKFRTDLPKLNGKVYFSKLPTEGETDEKSMFTDPISEAGDAKPKEESSTLEDLFFDAPEFIEVEENRNVDNPKNKINLHLKLEGEYFNVKVDDCNGTNLFKISRNDLENCGVTWTITSANKGIVTMNFNLLQEPMDPRNLVDLEVRSALVLNVGTLSKTENATMVTSEERNTMDSISEEDQEPQSDAFMVSEISEDCLQTFDFAQEVKSCEERSLENGNDLSENEAKTKPLTDSTVSSIPMDTFTRERGRSDASPSISDSRVVNTYSEYPTVPLIKSKSDPVLLSRRVLKKNDAVSSFYEKSEFGEGCFFEKFQNIDYNFRDWGKEREYFQYDEVDIDKPHEEAPERPMTSVADAVNSMHRALKPINDQINDIRTKMIGMNIQPRASSRPRRTLVPEMPSQDSNLSIQSRINRWLVTDPVEFSSSARTTTSDVSAWYEYIQDVPPTNVSPKSRFGKMVIFPRNLEIPGSNFDRTDVIDRLSATRSSILTEPEDIMTHDF